MATNKVEDTNTKKERYTFFWRHTSPFSQWHACGFTVNGIAYNCAEQYMMHQKAVLFKDDAMAAKILKSDSPKDQKAYGRKVSNFDATVWNEHCREIVKDGNYAKFGQNEELWKEMVSTEGTVLVEASPRDRIWGIGLGAQNPKALRKATWRGKNWLGYALTEVRERIIKERGIGGAKEEGGAAAATGATDGEKSGQDEKKRGKEEGKGKKRKRSAKSAKKSDSDDEQ